MCEQRDLWAAVTRMGEAGEDLVDRLVRARAASKARFQAHVRPWLDRVKAEAAARRAADKAAGTSTGRTGTGRGDDDIPGIS